MELGRKKTFQNEKRFHQSNEGSIEQGKGDTEGKKKQRRRKDSRRIESGKVRVGVGVVQYYLWYVVRIHDNDDDDSDDEARDGYTKQLLEPEGWGALPKQCTQR